MYVCYVWILNNVCMYSMYECIYVISQLPLKAAHFLKPHNL